MHDLPETVQFCLRTTERINSSKPESLSAVERVILWAYTFNMEEQNGGLSQFFYNTDASSEVADETAYALEVIGARKIAAVLRAAATVVCRLEYKDFVGTWGSFLSKVDPEQRLRQFELELGEAGESIDDALETFILEHRNEIEK